MNNPNHSFRNKVLIIHDNRFGHLNPSIAAAEIISKNFYLQPEQFAIPALPKHAVSILKKFSHFPRFFNILSSLYFTYLPAHIEQTDLIICSGMPNLIYAAYLSQKFNIPLMYVGGTRRFNSKLIDWTINVIPEDHLSSQISVPTIPVRQKISNLIHIPPNNEACLLLGGPTQEYPFTNVEIDKIIQNFVQFSIQKDIPATVVCSRRTPALSAQMLQYIHSHNIELVMPQSSTPFYEVLKRSEYVFVTEDSSTMLSEAIQAGRKVISICRDDTVIDSMIQNFMNLAFIQRKCIPDIISAEFKPNQIQPHCIEQMITQRLSNDLRAQTPDISFYQCHIKRLAAP